MSSNADTGASEDAPAGPRGIAARRRARASRRFYLLTAASTLVPGLGLTRTRRQQGIVILAIFGVTLLALLIYGLTQGFAQSAIGVGVSRRALLWLIPAVLALAALWIYGIVCTARDNLPEGTSGAPKVAMITFAALACVLVLAPAAQSARYAVIQRSVLDTVFPSLAPDGATTPGDGDDPWAGTERVNVMLVGSDAGKDRTGIRPDSLMVASIDTQTGDTVLFGIPRNLQNVQFSGALKEQYPDGFNCGDACLMEHVWTLGEKHAARFPDDPNPGLTATKDAASTLLGLDIDYSAVVNLAGFQALVDAMGGVEIDVQERVCVGCSINSAGQVVFAQGEERYIEPGKQTLNGYYALWYSRSRAQAQDGDFSRMRRQRCMVGALVNQVNPMNMLARYPDLADVLKDNVSTDIPQEQLPAWAELVLRIQDTGSMQSLPLTNQNIDTLDPDYDKIHAMVDDAIAPEEPSSSSSSASPEGDGEEQAPSSSSTEAPTSTAPTSEAPAAEPSSSSSSSEDQLSDLSATC